MSSILGEDEVARFSQPPLALQGGMPAPPHLQHKSRSFQFFDRRPIEGALAAEGVHREMNVSRQGSDQSTSKRKHLAGDVDGTIEELGQHEPEERRPRTGHNPPSMHANEHRTDSAGSGVSGVSTAAETPTDDRDRFPPFQPERVHAHTFDDAGHRGHAHDPLEDQLYLFIGPSTFAGRSSNTDRRPSFVPDDDDVPIVSESPGAADIDIYETAYRDEIERIRYRAKVEEPEPTVFLNRRVDARLIAISGQAGRWMAKGEESLDKFNDATNFRARKAKVTEVSRALKAAAKEEYSKERSKRKQDTVKANVGGADFKETQPVQNAGSREEDTIGEQTTSSGATPRPAKAASFLGAFAGKSGEGAKQAKGSFAGLVTAMKDKAKSARSADAGT